MTASAADLRRDLLITAFQMPSVQTMVSRKSSITNAFVNAIIPVVVPTIEEIDEALSILCMQPADVRCAYCGDKASEWDHLRPLVSKRRPTGFITEIANLVPACGKCNQSKGNKQWREWMLSKARLSPTGRGTAGIAQRVTCLENYEQWKSASKFDFQLILGAEEWEQYWLLCDSVNEELRKSQEVANELRARILHAVRKNPVGQASD
jgi:hypothetical protein